MRLTIEKLIYGGDGLARTAPDAAGRRKAIFVPFVLDGEQIDATVIEEKPGFLRARADKILKPSPERAVPACPYFVNCGGCHYQHTTYEHQLQIKSAILRETIERIAKVPLPEQPHLHAAAPWNYRNRTRMKVRGGRRFAMGYHRFASHELLPVEQCPISSRLINRAIEALWKLGRAEAVPREIEEIEFFASHDDESLLLELNLDDHATQGISSGITQFVRALRGSLPAIAGVAVFRRQGQNLRHEMIPQPLRDIFGAQELTYHAAEGKYRVSAGSFFQTNRHLTDTMVHIVTHGRMGDFALDLYSGVGLFTLPMSQNFREVASVEAAPYSYHDLRRNSPSNVTAYHTSTEQFLSGARDIAQFDYVVVDPPRGGMGEEVAKKLGELGAPRITYVSCDPATLARDLTVLLAAGYLISKTHLIDLFPQTFHIESIVELKVG
ncbi:MAG TPA: 23S rRNA (uracil(1939)-C(5))-methyltransferase RlmD [Terriglobales bacterium]|nr:23S rRNA (uracil(1939)-C(5))-methyltransferase RlmD [Terriglobales bacterium]